MANGMSARPGEHRETQLHTIRDLMLSASRRGAWLTLGEIAGLTEIGEASISAQLRHLRKRRHGRHLVEKRRRVHPIVSSFCRHAQRTGKKRIPIPAAVWEYRVIPPDGLPVLEWSPVEPEGTCSASAAER
jgi:hypothetical protein